MLVHTFHDGNSVLKVFLAESPVNRVTFGSQRFQQFGDREERTNNDRQLSRIDCLVRCYGFMFSFDMVFPKLMLSLKVGSAERRFSRLYNERCT